MTATTVTTQGTYYFRVTIDGVTSAVATLTVGAKTATVATQNGTINAGTAGSATFAVTTANITNGQAGSVTWYTTSAGTTTTTAPTGITSSVSSVSGNAATVTMTATTTATAGTYWFKVTIDGVTSAVATLTVSGAKTVTVASQSGTINAGTAGSTATFAVTTANIADGRAGSVTWYLPPAGTIATTAPTGLISYVSSVSGNAATVTMTATTAAMAGTYWFRVTIDGVTSGGVVTLTVSRLTSAPELALTTSLQAWMRGGLLHVEGLTIGETLSIYSATGALVYQGVATSEEMDIPIKAEGVYIIQSGERSVKAPVNF
jgi:hypothetical protein